MADSVDMSFITGDVGWAGQLVPGSVIKSTADMVNQAIAKLKPGQKIGRLIIVGHGDSGGSGGFISFDSGVTDSEVIDGGVDSRRDPLNEVVRAQLGRLREYFAPDGVVEFRCCCFGRKEHGARALQEVADVVGVPATGPEDPIRCVALLNGITVRWATAFPAGWGKPVERSFWRGSGGGLIAATQGQTPQYVPLQGVAQPEPPGPAEVPANRLQPLYGGSFRPLVVAGGLGAIAFAFGAGWAGLNHAQPASSAGPVRIEAQAPVPATTFRISGPISASAEGNFVAVGKVCSGWPQSGNYRTGVNLTGPSGDGWTGTATVGDWQTPITFDKFGAFSGRGQWMSVDAKPLGGGNYSFGISYVQALTGASDCGAYSANVKFPQLAPPMVPLASNVQIGDLTSTPTGPGPWNPAPLLSAVGLTLAVVGGLGIWAAATRPREARDSAPPASNSETTAKFVNNFQAEVKRADEVRFQGCAPAEFAVRWGKLASGWDPKMSDWAELQCRDVIETVPQPGDQPPDVDTPEREIKTF